MNTFTPFKVLLLLLGIFLSIPAICQQKTLNSALHDLSYSINSDDKDAIEDSYVDLTRVFKRVKGKELKIEMYLQAIEHLIKNHPDNAAAHDLIFQQLRLLRKIDRKREHSSKIIEQVKAFNLLLYDSEMIEKNVTLAEKVDKENAKEIATYLRSNSKVNQQIKSINQEKEAIDSTIEEAQEALYVEIEQKEKEAEKIRLLFDKSMDSMQMISAINSLKRAQISSQLEQEKANLALQKSRSQTIIFSLVAIAGALLLLGLLYFKLIRSSRKMKQQKKVIEQEKEKYEALLLNILPAKIADELKEHNSVQPQYYDRATVFFADFVNFSKITQKLTKEQLIKDINGLFCLFDDLTDKYEIEKIKTIGDAYMCVSGLPDASTHDAVKVIQFSKEIIASLEEWNKARTSIFLPHFDIRIGIHSGPLTAGIVGRKKFTYDIWGNTVNTAARMESKSEKNRINISESTLALIKDKYQVEPRGSIAIKNMGEVNMYFIK